MKVKLLSTLLLCIPFISTSQVSLTDAMAPALNTMVIYHDANVPSPPFVFSKTGTSNTWDFSVIAPVAGADDTTFVVAPSSVPNGSSFPAATHCTYEGGESSFTMMQINAGGVRFHGTIADIAGNGNMIPLVINPYLQAMAFPYVYGSTGSGTGVMEFYATGTSVGQPSMDSVHYKSTVSGQRDVLASGDMILPTGTLQAILERGINTNIDTVWMKGAATGNQWAIVPGFPQSSTDSSFKWYTNQSLLPYAHALYDDTGLHDVNYYKTTVSGVTEATQLSVGSVFPNPVNDVLYFNLPANMKGNTLEVFNAQGQQVLKGSTSFSFINVSLLTPGIYFLHITAAGNQHIAKFIKD